MVSDKEFEALALEEHYRWAKAWAKKTYKDREVTDAELHNVGIVPFMHAALWAREITRRRPRKK